VKKYYIKGSTVRHHHTSKSSFPFRTILGYIFVACSGISMALFALFINLPVSTVAHNTEVVSPVADTPQVLGAQEEAVISLIPTATAAPTPQPSPTIVQPKKGSYRIAVFGDSMVDTMGELLEYLDHELKRRYPTTTFGLYNYGVGAQNIDEGRARFNSEFSYSTRKYPPLPLINADIIIIGSFAYNPFSPHDRDRHWLGLTHLVQEAQKTGADVYILAEIAPLKIGFGKGPNGVNWSDSTSYQHANRIIDQLENAVGLANTLRVPLINVYAQSQGEDIEKSGKRKYVNPSDGIHPSVEGHEFTAKIIVDTIKLE
jgi:hypothetical protein